MNVRRLSTRFLDSPHGMSITIAGALLLVAMVVAVFSLSRVGQSVGWVTHTYHVIAQVNGVVAALREAEIAHRAYLITAGEEFEQNYQARAQLVHEVAAVFDDLGGGSPQQGARLKRLQELVSGRLEQLDMLARLRKDLSLQEVASAFVEDAAQLPAAEMRKVLEDVIAEELALLEQRNSRMESEMRNAAITIVACGCIALVMSGHTFYLMRRALAALVRESQLIREKERAEKSSDEKSAFLAHMSHEIRTPLNAVLGFTELLRGAVTTARQRQYVDAINASGTSLLALINDILDLSKIEAGRLDVQRQPVSVLTIFENLRSIFRAQAEERGLKLIFDSGEDVPPSLLLDPLRLRQILFNVVGNALKFTRQGSVNVHAHSVLTEGDETSVTLTIRVSDTGIGIAPEHQQLIFEPFRQVHSEVVAPGSGTGLGLSITRRLTEMLDGKVLLESALGRGSTFTFEFKRVPISAAIPGNSDDAGPNKDFNTLRPSLILIADDVPLNRELIAGFLNTSHHRLLHAASGREAIEATTTRHPDLVLMDLRMPDIDGREAFARIRSNPATASISVVAVTASTMIDEEKTMRASFDGFLRKPFSRSALFRELARHLPVDAASAPEEIAQVEEVAFSGFPDNLEGLPSWKPMIEQLRKLEHEQWPDLVRSMGFHETEAFGRRLNALAAEAGCPPLKRYADRLRREVANFEIEHQEKTLKSFPQIVAALARSTASLPS